jgi:hypothetical protein
LQSLKTKRLRDEEACQNPNKGTNDPTSVHDLDNVIWKALTTSQAKFPES